MITDAHATLQSHEAEEGGASDEWLECALADIATTTSGGTPDRTRSEFFGGSIPWVKSGELNDSQVTYTEETITEDGLIHSSAKMFPVGTLLIAMYGATAGKTGVLGIDAATNQAVCAIFPRDGTATPDFLRFLFIQQRAELLKRRYGGAQPNISQNVIRSFPNSRFCVLPGVDCPNLATRLLALNLARLSADWEHAYGHPILAVESFVDGQLFRGTCYKAQGWTQLGPTRGYGRHAEDYYIAHERPKQLWVRTLQADARERLRAPVLPPALQPVEAKILPRPEVRLPALHTLVELCRAVPDWRGTKGRDYPLPGLLAVIVLAMLCGVVRGQRDLAAFASGLTQPQLRALLCRKGRDGRYQHPKETTFFRILTGVDEARFTQVLNQWIETSLGPCDQLRDTLIAIDGKALRGSTPHCPDEQKAQWVGAVSLPSGRSLGTVLVEEKSNEIPAARALLDQLGPLDGKLVMLDALHANQATLRSITQDHGADYLVPVKDNHEALRHAAEQSLPGGTAPPPSATGPATPPPAAMSHLPNAGVSPPKGGGVAATPVRYRRQRGNQSRPVRTAQPALGRDHA